MGPALADASLVKTGFYRGYTVSTAITGPTEAKCLFACSLSLTRLAGVPKATQRLHKNLDGVCVYRKKHR